jgi:hypothetical protein
MAEFSTGLGDAQIWTVSESIGHPDIVIVITRSGPRISGGAATGSPSLTNKAKDGWKRQPFSTLEISRSSCAYLVAFRT